MNVENEFYPRWPLFARFFVQCSIAGAIVVSWTNSNACSNADDDDDAREGKRLIFVVAEAYQDGTLLFAGDSPSKRSFRFPSQSLSAFLCFFQRLAVSYTTASKNRPNIAL